MKLLLKMFSMAVCTRSWHQRMASWAVQTTYHSLEILMVWLWWDHQGQGCGQSTMWSMSSLPEKGTFMCGTNGSYQFPLIHWSSPCTSSPPPCFRYAGIFSLLFLQGSALSHQVSPGGGALSKHFSFSYFKSHIWLFHSNVCKYLQKCLNPPKLAKKRWQQEEHTWHMKKLQL